MSYQLTIGGQVYVFDSQNEYKQVKHMNKSEQETYVEENIGEDSLQILNDDFEEDENSTGTTSSDDSAELNYLNEQINSLESDYRQLINSICGNNDTETVNEILNEADEIRSEISSLRTQVLQCLNGNGSDVSNNGEYSTSSYYNLTGSGSDIVKYAEQFLGENNPSKKAGENKFVRVQRGGSCDDFATYVIDHSMNEDDLADWYKNLSEKNKAWGPDIFNAAQKAGATVSVENARAGDLAFINLNGVGKGDHTVIVKEVKDGKLYAIDSKGGKVKNRTYDLDLVDRVARVTNS